MENRRFLLIALMGVVLFFLYQAWQTDYASTVIPQTEAHGVTSPTADDIGLPSPESVPAGSASPPPNPAGVVHVETDLVSAEIALTGGELRRYELHGYPEFKDQSENLSLLDDRGERWFVMQSGIAGTSATPQAVYASAQKRYTLADGANTLEVPLEYTDASGYSVRKVFRFTRGSYQMTLQQSVKNLGTAAVNASPYVRFARTVYNVGAQPKFSKTFLGVGLYQQKSPGSYKFNKMSFEDISKTPVEDFKQTGGWLVMLQHYFIAAIIPPADESLSFSAKPGRARGYVGQYQGATVSVPPQGEHSFETRLYIGPQLQDSISDVAERFDLTLDYGILTVIAKPLFWFLEVLHKFLGNWGFSIILLTLAVKLAMLKLSEAQYRSMAKMKKFGPRIQEIKERYGDDRERQQKAMMELYKKEGFNPLAGCWPLLVQMPVFFALYWVLLQSVELRQVPFALWIHDLSAPDPYFVLPVLYGISMWLTQKLNGQNAAMDPMQQKMMNVMPIALTAFFTFFPSGLVLYWLASSVIGIAQQFYITRKLEREGLTR